jgi:membrane associated rhomboid family serine protease
MLDDRHYMRPDYRPRAFLSSSMPVTVMLMIAITVVYVVQKFCSTYTRFPFDEYFALSNRGLSQWHVWQLLTYQFLHANPGHLVSNLLGLWFIGRPAEERMGKSGFLRCYFMSGVAGGVLQAALTWLFPLHFGLAPVVGASAGIVGVFAAFATMEPYGEMLLFFLIPVRMRYLLIASIAVSLYFVLVPSGSMAHAAHLGGILFGIGYIHWGMNSAPAWDEWNPLRRKLRREKMIRAANVKPALLRRRPKADEPQDLPSEEFISKQVDPILDKISAHGIQSLTERERQILQAARARMSKR